MVVNEVIFDNNTLSRDGEKVLIRVKKNGNLTLGTYNSNLLKFLFFKHLNILMCLVYHIGVELMMWYEKL